MYNWLRKLFGYGSTVLNKQPFQPDPPPYWIYESALAIEERTGITQYIIWIVPEQWYTLAVVEPTSGVWYTSDRQRHELAQKE